MPTFSPPRIPGVDSSSTSTSTSTGGTSVSVPTVSGGTGTRRIAPPTIARVNPTVAAVMTGGPAVQQSTAPLSDEQAGLTQKSDASAQPAAVASPVMDAIANHPYLASAAALVVGLGIGILVSKMTTSKPEPASNDHEEPEEDEDSDE